MRVHWVAEERHKICPARIEAELLEQRSHLAAMMRLMIEEMRDRDPQWHVPVTSVGHRMVAHRAGKPFGADLFRPVLDHGVGRCTLAAENFKIRVKLLSEGFDRDRLSRGIIRD